MQARREGTTISGLVRDAARRRYMGGMEERSSAMQAFAWAGKGRTDLLDAVKHIRSLRRGNRLERLRKQ
jgi:hypothetical protein